MILFMRQSGEKLFLYKHHAEGVVEKKRWIQADI